MATLAKQSFEEKRAPKLELGSEGQVATEGRPSPCTPLGW